MKDVSIERLIKDARRVLDYPFWIPDVETMRRYTRIHDDHDGTFQGAITVIFSKDGDAWVEFDPTHNASPLRFRGDLGGGMSLRTKNALMILALAIKLDNEEAPQR
ncbi:MAG: hypothetical protein V1686_01700 [Patescibacteria group bacterium]